MSNPEIDPVTPASAATPASAPSAATPDEPDTFPRQYVEELREESATRRREAQEAREALEPVQRRLHALLVGATGRLADPDDLEFDAAHLDDEEALTAAIDDLLQRKPHLASRRTRGNIGQGEGDPAKGSVNLAGMLAARA